MQQEKELESTGKSAGQCQFIDYDDFSFFSSTFFCHRWYKSTILFSSLMMKTFAIRQMMKLETQQEFIYRSLNIISFVISSRCTLFLVFLFINQFHLGALPLQSRNLMTLNHSSVEWTVISISSNNLLFTRTRCSFLLQLSFYSFRSWLNCLQWKKKIQLTEKSSSFSSYQRPNDLFKMFFL